MEGDSTGRISEWNEGTFKSSRLHESQFMINSFKLNPLQMSEGKFNYVWLLHHIDVLYGEGYSKYSTKERDEVDIVRKICFRAVEDLNPAQIIMEESMSGSTQKIKLNKELLSKLLDILLLFERKVKDLNDKHGLTTQNREDDMGDPLA